VPKQDPKKEYSLWTIPKAEWHFPRPKAATKSDARVAVERSARDQSDTFKPVPDSELPAVKLD